MGGGKPFFVKSFATGKLPILLGTAHICVHVGRTGHSRLFKKKQSKRHDCDRGCVTEDLVVFGRSILGGDKSYFIAYEFSN